MIIDINTYERDILIDLVQEVQTDLIIEESQTGDYDEKYFSVLDILRNKLIGKVKS
jgi:hypothetical protein